MASETTSASTVKLIHDTLLHVIAVSDYTKDAVALMATSRFLYHQGAKIALKRPVIIHDSEQLALFLKFLRAEDLSRCRYLRQLALCAFYPERHVAQELVQTLPLLINLEYLHVCEAEDLLDSHHALPLAFAALPSLRHIDMSGAKGITCALLPAIQSPLVSAKVSFISEDDEIVWDHLDPDQWPEYHPVVLFAKVASTLEELRCVGWHTPLTRTVIPDKVYPNMRKLSLELPEIPLRMDPFIRAFPNLTHLRVHITDKTYKPDPFELQFIRESHEANVERQLNSCGTWRHLEYLGGFLPFLYATGLVCHIQRMAIVDVLADGPMEEIFKTVFDRARPLHLKLDAITGSMLGNPDRGFISMLRSESASGLLTLDVNIFFEEEDREKDLSLLIDHFVSALCRLPLKLLRVEFYTRALDPTPKTPDEEDDDDEGEDEGEGTMHRREVPPNPPEPAPVPFPLSPAELSLNKLDMDALMTRMGAAVPSLEAALVKLRGTRPGHAWQERTIMKGTARLPGEEAWYPWSPKSSDCVARKTDVCDSCPSACYRTRFESYPSN